MPKRKLVSITEDVIKKFKTIADNESYEGEGGHWLWYNRKDEKITIDKIYYLITRIAWSAYVENNLSDDEKLKRICDRPGCFNPDHRNKVTVNADKSIKRRKIENTDGDWESIRQRLAKRYREEDDHFIWTGYIQEGYGVSSHRGKIMGVHVLSWEAHNKQLVPENLVVRHKCQRKDCINPDHLNVGTRTENARDKIRDGTSGRGSLHPGAKIDEKTALEIFKSKGDRTISERATRYGVSIGIVRGIDEGRGWSWLTGLEPHKLTEKPKRVLTKEDYKKILGKLKEQSKIVEDPEFDHPHWLWKLGKDTKGYGQISFRSKQYFTHTISCEAFNERPRVEGEVVRHKCRFKECCSPFHLKFGSISDNMRDKKRDGKAPIGEKHPMATISEELAKEIKYSEKKGTQKERAKEYGVSVGVVGSIERGASWKHI